MGQDKGREMGVWEGKGQAENVSALLLRKAVQRNMRQKYICWKPFAREGWE